MLYLCSIENNRQNKTMFALLKKEISSFFSSLTGYIVISVFLLTNGLFLWVFSGENSTMNIFDGGYSTLDPLFTIAPWVFLFLIPAITMRLFSEESRTGTMELLLTHPLTDFQIVIAKYLSGLFLIILSLLPTLLYFFTVYALGSPVGNIDTGGTWGSYIGLFFLAAIYAAIGLFSSSISDNQIISFIIAMLVSFFFYIGFEFISSLSVFNTIESVILQLGINEHYRSISRGVIDTRDIVYYISVSGLFIYFAQLSISKRRK